MTESTSKGADARHTGTVHYEGLVVLETPKEGGQLIVMNRNGSLVIKDEKGRGY